MADKYCMTTTLHNFPSNPGYLLHRLSDQELEPIWREVARIEQAKGQGWRTAHQDLVGVIDREFHLNTVRDHIYALVRPLADRYIEHFDYAVKIHKQQNRTNGHQARDLVLGSLWLNLQRPGEYNPLHQHDGVFSFVIWLRTPYTLAEENCSGPGQRTDYKPNGDFHFHFTDTLGAIRTHWMMIDSSSDGTLCLFPAELHHVVYPYYSTDRTRISISGNLHLAL